MAWKNLTGACVRFTAARRGGPHAFTDSVAKVANPGEPLYTILNHGNP